MIDEVYIYAFRKAGKIVYVGQTVDLPQRITTHRDRTTKLEGLTRRENCQVLRIVTRDKANRIERQIIIALKKQGQCELNVSLPHLGKPITGRTSSGNTVVQSSTGQNWPSIKEAARYFGWQSAQTFKSNLIQGDGILKQDGVDHEITMAPCPEWARGLAAIRKAKQTKGQNQ